MTDTRINKNKNDWQSWKNKPYAASRSDEARRRAELWESFNTYCREGGGWLISPPGSRVAVLETMKDSDLAERLSKLGYERAAMYHQRPVQMLARSSATPYG
jgi:hypothetical protein